jgi:hypothetical protein
MIFDAPVKPLDGLRRALDAADEEHAEAGRDAEFGPDSKAGLERCAPLGCVGAIWRLIMNRG